MLTSQKFIPIYFHSRCHSAIENYEGRTFRIGFIRYIYRWDSILYQTVKHSNGKLPLGVGNCKDAGIHACTHQTQSIIFTLKYQLRIYTCAQTHSNSDDPNNNHSIRALKLMWPTTITVAVTTATIEREKTAKNTWEKNNIESSTVLLIIIFYTDSYARTHTYTHTHKHTPTYMHTFEIEVIFWSNFDAELLSIRPYIINKQLFLLFQMAHKHSFVHILWCCCCSCCSFSIGFFVLIFRFIRN